MPHGNHLFIIIYKGSVCLIIIKNLSIASSTIMQDSKIRVELTDESRAFFFGVFFRGNWFPASDPAPMASWRLIIVISCGKCYVCNNGIGSTARTVDNGGRWASNQSAMISVKRHAYFVYHDEMDCSRFLSAACIGNRVEMRKRLILILIGTSGETLRPHHYCFTVHSMSSNFSGTNNMSILNIPTRNQMK